MRDRGRRPRPATVASGHARDAQQFGDRGRPVSGSRIARPRSTRACRRRQIRSPTDERVHRLAHGSAMRRGVNARDTIRVDLVGRGGSRALIGIEAREGRSVTEEECFGEQASRYTTHPLEGRERASGGRVDRTERSDAGSPTSGSTVSYSTSHMLRIRRRGDIRSGRALRATVHGAGVGRRSPACGVRASPAERRRLSGEIGGLLT